MVRTETKPIWTSSSFLIYTGGLTVLAGAFAGLKYLGQNFDASALALWSFVFLAIVYGIALGLLGRDRWLPAGILGFVSVILWAVFLDYLFAWFGWSGPHGSFENWSWSRLLFWFLVLVSASFDRRLFRFPFISAISVVVAYLFVVDLLTSGTGNWFTFVTLFIGFVYLLLGTAIGTPSTFWLHLAGGALIGYALLSWFHTSDFDFALISIFAVFFVLTAYATRRSSWAVYGTIGFFAATFHYVVGSPAALLGGVTQPVLRILEQVLLGGITQRCTSTLLFDHCTGSTISLSSVALALGLLGFWLMLLGMLGRPRRRNKQAAVVVEVLPAE